jgi:hypothetical protein
MTLKDKLEAGRWNKWHELKPEEGVRVLIRSADYNGEADYTGGRLRPWHPTDGYGEHFDADPLAEWSTLSQDDLPKRFAVD